MFDSFTSPNASYSNHCDDNEKRAHSDIQSFETLDNFPLNHSQSGSGMHVMMPPDLVSVSTTCTSGEDHSVSSLSSDEGFGRRSLFSKHWENTVQTKTRISRAFASNENIVTRACPFATESDEEDEDDSGNTYERTLKTQEGIKTTSSSSNRRSIFSGCHPALSLSERSSSNCFAMNTPLATTGRRACSDSVLVVKKSPSCLRASKYSGQSPPHKEYRTTPVSFSSDVTVVKYETSQEQWASCGWSSYFH